MEHLCFGDGQDTVSERKLKRRLEYQPNFFVSDESCLFLDGRVELIFIELFDFIESGFYCREEVVFIVLKGFCYFEYDRLLLFTVFATSHEDRGHEASCYLDICRHCRSLLGL